MTDDDYIYKLLVSLMKIIQNDESLLKKIPQYFHANIILLHFTRSKIYFTNNQNGLYQQFLLYYHKKCILQSFSNKLGNEQNADNLMFLNSMKKVQQVFFDFMPKQNQILLCQIITKILVIGVRCYLKQEVEKKYIKEVVKYCLELQNLLLFENRTVSEILCNGFLDKIMQEIKVLPFYQILLKVFNKLDYYKPVQIVKDKIAKLREQWNKEQNNIQIAKLTKKTIKRDTFFMPINKENLSLDSSRKKISNHKKQNQNNQNQEAEQWSRTITMSVVKIKQQKQTIRVVKTNFKKLAESTKHKKPVIQARRKTLCNKNMYEFKSNKSQFVSSQQSSELEIFSNSQLSNSRQGFMFSSKQFIGMRSGYEKDRNRIEQNDVLVENTPERRKKRVNQNSQHNW